MVPTAYEGKENYIFISYAHADREEVFKLLSEFEEKGYRFWYDDGIAPGSEWPEDIAQHLNNSYVVMAIITPRSVNSVNCKREINYALAQNKHFLSVILEKTEMSAGLEMQLSSQQSVIRYNYTSHEAFMKKILNSPFILPCKQEIIEEPAEPEKPETPAEPEKIEAPVKETVQAEETVTPVQETAELEKASAKAEDTKPANGFALKKKAASEKKAEETAPEATAKKGGKRTPLIILGVAAVLALALILIPLTSKVSTSWGETYKKDLYNITAEDVTVQQSDIDNLCKLKHPENLYFKNCDLSGCDISPLIEKLDSNSVIRLDGCTGIKDFSFFGNTSAYDISLEGVSDFTDLSVIPTADLHSLNISGTGVKDISVLSDASQLNELNISNTAVTDISPIASLEGLTTLNISNCKTGDLKTGFKALALEELYVSGCGMSDLSAFSNCTRLVKLNISRNPGIKDMSWLNSQNSTTLTELNVAETGLDSAALAGISNYKGLTWIRLDGTALEDLNFLNGHSALEFLSAQGCGLKDISGLKGSSGLKTVLLSFNKIDDIGGLASLKPGENNEIQLDLSFNSLKDISKLPEGSYHTLLLAGNDQTLASTMPAGVKAYSLSTDWYDGILKSSFAGTSNFYYIYIIGTPDSEKLNVEEKLIEGTVETVTADKLYTEYLANDSLGFNTYTDFSYAVELYKNR